MNREKTQLRINKIAENNFTVDDVQLLFYELREKCKNQLVREIGDFIHTERTKGLTFNHLQKTAENIVNTFKVGGDLKITELCNSQVLIDSLEREILSQDYTLNNNSLQSIKDKFCEYTIDFLEGIKIKIKVDKIVDCKLVKTQIGSINNLTAEFTPEEDLPGVVTWYKNVKIAIPVITL